MPRIAVMLVAGLFLLVQGNQADARFFRPAMLPNAPDGCNTCHTNGGGTARNPFGLDVEALVTPNGNQQFWGPALAALDSDGDGVSNGVELADPDGDGDADPNIPVTSPGDPDSFVLPPIKVDTWLDGADAADLNDDGFTDEIDFYFFDAEAWFGSPEEFDFNFDGTVDFADYFLWVDANSAAPPPPVDEPPDGPIGEPPELTALFNLHQQFLNDPNLELVFVDELVDLEPFVRDILLDFSGGTGELSLADVENAIATFQQSPPASFELELLFGLLEEFDVDPNLEFILVDDLTALEEEDRLFLRDVAMGDGELTRQDIDEAIAQFEVGVPPEQELVLSLLEEFDFDQSIEVIFVDDLTHLDDFQRDFLTDISGGTEEIRRADLEAFLGDTGPGPVDEFPELVLLRQLNEEFLLDPGLDVIFIDALDIPDFERDFLFSLAPNGELTRVVVADELAALEGPALSPELEFLFSLLAQFDNDPGLVIFAAADGFDEFEQNILFQFSDDAGALRREDIDRAIAAFNDGGEPSLPPEIELLFLLLSDFDLDPTLELLSIDQLAEQFDPTTISFLRGGGRIRR